MVAGNEFPGVYNFRNHRVPSRLPFPSAFCNVDESSTLLVEKIREGQRGDQETVSWAIIA